MTKYKQAKLHLSLSLNVRTSEDQYCFAFTLFLQSSYRTWVTTNVVKRRKIIISSAAECYQFVIRQSEGVLAGENDIDLVGGSSRNSIPIKKVIDVIGTNSMQH